MPRLPPNIPRPRSPRKPCTWPASPPWARAIIATALRHAAACRAAYPHGTWVADATYVEAESHLQLGHVRPRRKSALASCCRNIPVMPTRRRGRSAAGCALPAKEIRETIDWLQPKLAKLTRATDAPGRGGNQSCWREAAAALSSGGVPRARPGPGPLAWASRPTPAATAGGRGGVPAGGRPVAAKPAGPARPLWAGLGKARPERLHRRRTAVRYDAGEIPRRQVGAPAPLRPRHRSPPAEGVWPGHGRRAGAVGGRSNARGKVGRPIPVGPVPDGPEARCRGRGQLPSDPPRRSEVRRRRQSAL